MALRKLLLTGVAAIGITAFVVGAPSVLAAQQAASVAIDNDDIGGVVTGRSGPEAGVWVIAETRDLPVRYIKIVVTDDRGRYVIPDLPKANYDVWVRGYGLVDSPKVKSVPGKQLNLTAVPAPNEAAAANYYPAIYWYSMMKIPEASVFGSKEAPANVKITDYLNGMKNNGCVGCHQLGQLSTRTIPKFHLDGKSHQDAWVRRVQSGQAGETMVLQAAGQLGGMPFKYLADWTERVAKGELPDVKPTRPQGVPWPSTNDKILYRTVLPAEFVELSAKHGVVGTVVVEASPWLEDNQWILDQAKDNPIVVGFVGNLAAGSPEFAAHRMPSA